MKVTVKFFATLRLALGVGELDLELTDPVSVGELVDLTAARVNPLVKSKLLLDGKIRKGTLLLVDGRNVAHLQELDTLIEQDCIVSFFPPAGGG